MHYAGEDLVDVDAAGAAAVLGDGVDELVVRQLLDRLAALAPSPATRVPAGRARQVVLDRDGHPYLPGQAVAPRSLPHRVRQALASPPGGDASAHLGRVLLLLAHRHWTHTMAAGLVERTPAFEHIRTRRTHHTRVRVARSAAEQRRVLARQWARAVAAAAAQPMVADDATRAAIRATVSQIRTATRTVARWGVQAGEADRAVLAALCRLALLATQLTISASVRQLAEMTGISSSTVDRALHRLALDQRIVRDSPCEGTRAAVWQVRSPEHWVESVGGSEERESSVGGREVSVPPPIGLPDEVDPEGELDAELAVLSADVFAHRRQYGGLGRQAARVYLALRTSKRATDASTIATTTGHTLGTTQRHLAQLDALGLAARTPRGKWRTGRRTLNAAARMLGCHGVGAARARRHTTARALYTWWTEELTAMHSPTTGVRTGPRTPLTQTRVPLGLPDRAGHRRYPRTHGRANHTTAAAVLEPTQPSIPMPGQRGGPQRPARPNVPEAHDLAGDAEAAAIDLLVRVLGASRIEAVA